jgi:hypothetical protein
VNRVVTLLYCHAVKAINGELPQEERAEDRERVISFLSTRLTQAHGKGWVIFLPVRAERGKLKKKQ